MPEAAGTTGTPKALAWGQPTIKFCKSVDGEPDGDWKTIPTPKEGSTKLENKVEKELKVEGGETIAARMGAEFSFELYLMSTSEQPFTDIDGFVEGKYAFKLLPNSPQAVAMQIDASSVRVEKTWSADEGFNYKVVASVSKPKTLPMVKFVAGVASNTETR